MLENYGPSSKCCETTTTMEEAWYWRLGKGGWLMVVVAQLICLPLGGMCAKPPFSVSSLVISTADALDEY